MFRKVLSNKLPINFNWVKINRCMSLSFNFAVVKLTSQVHPNIPATTNQWLIWNLILEKDLIPKRKLQTINMKDKNQVLIFRGFKLPKTLVTIKIIFHLKLALKIQIGKTTSTTIVLVQKWTMTAPKLENLSVHQTTTTTKNPMKIKIKRKEGTKWPSSTTTSATTSTMWFIITLLQN